MNRPALAATGPAGRPGAAPPALTAPPDLTGWSIGVIGLGTMGGGMAHRLADAGATLRVYNRSRATAEAFAAERGATVGTTPADIADAADVVLVSVADGEAMRSVLTGPDGVSQAPRPPRVVLNTSTVAPESLRLVAAGLPLLAAGVLGNGTHARQGQLRWYVGGPPHLLDAVQPVLAALGQQVMLLGELTAGMHLKVAMNLLMGLEMQALAEVVALAEAAGLARALVLDAVGDSGFAAPVMRFKARRMAADSYTDPDFRLRLMAKDLALAVAQAAQQGVELPLARTAADTHASGVAAGLGDADCAAILRVVQQLPGSEVGT